MIRTKKRMMLCLLLIAALLAFIWGNSLLTAEHSRAFSDWVRALLFGPPSGTGGGEGSGLLRKIAHFTEFFALGMCLMWLSGMLRRGKLQPFLWGMAAACIDETIQIFVPGRGPGLLDVAIDSSGVLTGIILVLIGHLTINKKKTLRRK